MLNEVSSPVEPSLQAAMDTKVGYPWVHTLRVCMYVCIHVYTCMYIYIYTYKT